MKRFAIGLCVVVFGLCLTRQDAHAQVSAGISISQEGARGFYLAVGDYYRVPEKEVVTIQKRGLPDEEIPVLLFIAARARVAPGVIIDFRLDGMSWMDICIRHGLNAEAFYVPIKTEVKGPPYGKAYGYYKKKPRKEWKTIVLTDADIINLVNLRFLTEHYGHAPGEVITMRSEGKSFVVVHHEVKKGKKEKVGSSAKEEKGKKKK